MRTNRSFALLLCGFAAACAGRVASSHGNGGGGLVGGGGGGADGGASGADGGGGQAMISVSPVSIALRPGATQTFTCTILGGNDRACSWSVQERGGGSVTSSGLYTAPATAGTYHVIAAGTAAPTLTATAAITVVAPTPGSCAQLPAAGTWEDITPAQLDSATWCSPSNNGCPGAGQTATYGIHAFVLDPNHAGTIFLGTASMGLWKSADCGSTWAHIDTGSNADAIDKGRNWTLAIDPTDSNVLYTNSGYYQGGVFKSVDGGVNFTQVLTQNILEVASFVEKITLDPTDNRHLLVSFHSPCMGTPLPGATTDSSGGWGCLAESNDAGATWSLTTAAVPWQGLDGPGQTMIDGKTWYYATNSCPGLYRTTTGGVSPDGHSSGWTEVWSDCSNGSVYKASNGAFYSGAFNVLISLDGVQWSAIDGSPAPGYSVNGSTLVADDGQLLYVMSRGAYYTAPLGTSTPKFTQIDSTPTMNPSYSGNSIVYDATNHLLYSANMAGGFWRYKAP